MSDQEIIEGTVRDLWQLRQARRSTQDTIKDLKRAGMDTTALQVTLDHLNETVVLLPVPCLVCRKNFPQPAKVADDALPYAVICADCDKKITAEIGASPKRKRRTKEQMEADRLARKAATAPDE